ncbi:binding-protein-dependent transport systems inner membrane component [Novosphingobium nitrogenifigens DSM 19370]|uniref:Binding-protein-dependent transport systems inner membrane component n=1 Tax=Novosphingobium nitrogenifigens DSM 19370 TaxID=983920 RepID=F1ZCG3_9SPHN|nr:ABC transporter permease subunit [Novosphingobium nitrogenifigens]EGD57754.1 binding-protein-dependent transport systems inner membrane component [Novosphingobium nitrogenifigens DSM 19370]
MTRIIAVRPGRRGRLIAGALPLLLLLLGYALASALRHADNPADKVLPTLSAMAAQAWRLATEPDPVTGQITLLADTLASLTRLGAGLALATGTALVLGLVLGVVPLARAVLGPVITLIAVIPPIAVLPILFIALGLGEAAKVALIAIGIAPYMTRDLAAYVAGLPPEQFVKAQTLGANSWQVAIRVALPQMMPRLFETLRFSMGPAWVFLIAAEAIASDVGLGYRIFLVRRYLAMDIILPYVAWISILAIAADALLLLVSRRAFPWAQGGAR